MRRFVTFIMFTALSLVSLHCGKQESGHFPIERALQIDLTEVQEQGGAVVVLEEDRIDIRGSNVCYWTHHQVKRILRARQQEEGFFRYPDNSYCEVVAIKARAVYPDGREEVLTELDIERMPDFKQFILYSDNCSRVFNLGGLRPGTVIDVNVRFLIKSLAFLPPTDFQREIPILEKRYSIEHPTDMDISIYTIGMTSEPDTVIEISGNRREMRWERKNIEAFEPERYMPPAQQYVPSLWPAVNETQEVGVEMDLASWKGMARWYEELCRGSMKCGNGVARLVAAEMVPHRSKEEIARAIFHRVQRDFRYVAIYLGLGGYMPHQAEETVEKLYGDCKDQSVVLATALREAGIGSHLVLVRTADRGRFEEPIPMIGYFNHVIVAVDIERRTIFLDPTCKTCSFGVLPHILQGAHGLIVRDGEEGLVTLPFGGAQENGIYTKAAIRINDEGEAFVADTIRCTGSFSELYRSYFENREGQTPEEIAKQLFLGDYPFGRITALKLLGVDPVHDSLIMYVEASIPEFVEKRQTVFLEPAIHRVSLPDIDLKNDRKYPLHLGTIRSLNHETTVYIPDGWRLEGLPEPFELDNGYMQFSGRYEGLRTRFRLVQSWRLEKCVAPLDDIADIEKASREIRAFDNAKVLIRKN
jgi:hypothetical protein